MKVLDVACGTGNTAIPEAKKADKVTGVDIASNLIEQARERAKQKASKIKFDIGDAKIWQYRTTALTQL